MVRSLARARIPAFMARPFNVTNAMKELDMYFQEKDPVHQTMHRIVKRLEKAKIDYAVMGGMAVFAHKHRRATNDVDILVTREGFEAFRRLFVPKQYGRSTRPRRFVDRTSSVTVDLLLTGLYPGNGDPGPIAFPEPSAVAKKMKGVRYIDLATLVQLKLAARRWQDYADVVKLIAANGLDESFAERLHASVRGDYIGCLDEKREDDRYEDRQDQRLREMMGE